MDLVAGAGVVNRRGAVTQAREIGAASRDKGDRPQAVRTEEITAARVAGIAYHRRRVVILGDRAAAGVGRRGTGRVR